MKYRVNTRDFIIFIIFCIFLMLMSALAVLNVISLINEGIFFGFNPLPAFAPPYLGATLVIFFAVLIAIFLSVSSYIFDKESGLGIKLGERDDKGYSRWAKAQEIKSSKDIAKVLITDSKSNAAGVALINNGKEMWVDNGESHTIVVGGTGSGKTTAIVNPLVHSLAKNGESMILTDPKGELYKDHSEMLRTYGYNVIVLNFRNPNLGSAWNPLILPYQLYKNHNIDKATELLEDVALNILYDPENKNDPFWEKSASDFFSGLALGLFEDAEENEINLNSINYMSTVGEENFATSNYTKAYFGLKGESSSAYVFASNTINAPAETKGSILSVFRQKIRLFASREQLSEMLSYSGFDMRDIGRKKTAVFMIIHDEKTTYHALATIFIKQCYETLIDVAQENGGKLPFRTNFILDEFANMPPLKDVTAMVTAARSRLIRFTFIIQNFAQLNEVYGKENSETIRSNCGNLFYLLTTELAALEEISKLCGEVKSKDKDKTASTPLITVSDLQKLKMNEVVIIKNRLNPFRTKLTPSYEIKWGTDYGRGEFISREPREVSLFDIKDYVKTKKRAQLFDALDNVEPMGEMSKNNFEYPVDPRFKNGPPLFGAGVLKDEEEDEKSNLNTFTNNKLPIFNPFNNPVISPKKDDYLNIDNQNHNIDILNDIVPSSFNYDDLLKRIDQNIAALEAAEKNKKSEIKQEDKKIEKLEPISNKLESPAIETLKANDEPIVKIDNESLIVGDNDTTDDQYFDDFFN